MTYISVFPCFFSSLVRAQNMTGFDMHWNMKIIASEHWFDVPFFIIVDGVVCISIQLKRKEIAVKHSYVVNESQLMFIIRTQIQKDGSNKDFVTSFPLCRGESVVRLF